MRKALAVLGMLILGAAISHAGGLGIYGSYWDTKDADSGYGGGAKLKFETVPNLYLELRGSYFPDLSKDDDGTKVDLRVVPLELGLAYNLPITDKFQPYIGGGGGGFYMDGDIKDDSIGLDGDIDFKIKPGYYAVAGVEFALTESVALFAEAKYTWVEFEVDKITFNDVDLTDDMGGDVTGKLDGLGANAGLMLKW